MNTLAHEEVVLIKGKRSGLVTIIAIHSTALGAAAGGCRMWTYPDWRDGLEDALRLSEAMTLKCALAGLEFGGGKSVIVLPPGLNLTTELRRDVMLDLGDAIQALGGRYVAGEDVGTTAEDMLVAHEQTEFAYCLPVDQGGIGEPSEPTAIGLFSAIRATCEHLYSDAEPKGRRVTIVGLGQVGSRIARLLTEAGAILTVTDIDPNKRELADQLGAIWIDVDRGLTNETDILVPAALGGILDADIVPSLRCRAIVGPANNQLAEGDVAQLLADAGILWAPDFLVNAGGVIFGALVDGSGVDPTEAMRRVEGVGATLEEIFSIAEREGSTPSAAAVALAQSRVLAARPA